MLNAAFYKTNPKGNIARRRRASTYITPRFHQRGTPASPDPSPADQNIRNEPKKTTPDAIGLQLYLTPAFQPGIPQPPKCAKRTQFHPPPSVPPPPISAKRTQFPPPLSSRASGCGAKRSGPKSRDLFNQHRRRRFRTNDPRPHPHYAKRTQFPHRRHPAAPAAPYYAKRTQFPAAHYSLNTDD